MRCSVCFVRSGAGKDWTMLCDVRLRDYERKRATRALIMRPI